MVSVHLTSAGMGALMLGDHAAAEVALIEALEASLVIDDRPGLVMRMEMLASSAAMAGRATRAAELLGCVRDAAAADRRAEEPVHAPHVETAREQARAVLGEDRFAKRTKAEHASIGKVPSRWRSGRSPARRYRAERTRSPIRSANASGRSRTSLPRV